MYSWNFQWPDRCLHLEILPCPQNMICPSQKSESSSPPIISLCSFSLMVAALAPCYPCLSRACDQASVTSTYNCSLMLSLLTSAQGHCLIQTFRAHGSTPHPQVLVLVIFPTMAARSLVLKCHLETVWALHYTVVLCLQTPELPALTLKASQVLAQSSLLYFLFCGPLPCTQILKNSPLSVGGPPLLVSVACGHVPSSCHPVSLIPQPESQPHAKCYTFEFQFKCCFSHEVFLPDLVGRMLSHLWDHTPLCCLVYLDS